MKNNIIKMGRKISSFLLIVGMAGFSYSTLLASPGTSSANFLKIGVGARGSAMGEAQSAVTEDVTSSYWNPAGLTHLRYQELSLMHYEWVEGIRYQQMSFGTPTATRGTFAFGINLLNYGDIKGYDSGAVQTGNVSASNLLLTGSWAKKLSEKSPLSTGINFKYLKSDLAGYKATAPMMDIGVLYPFETGRFRGLSLAADLRNVGPSIKYDSEGTPLPQQLVLGAGFSALGGNLIVALDSIKPKDGSAYLATGVEYRLFEMLNLRVGYNGLSNFVGNGITYGMGLRFTQWNLDYAFVPFGELGNTSRISVGIRFGQAMRMKNADEQVESSYRLAQRQYSAGKGVEAYATLNDLLLIAPWHKPSVELKAKIEKEYEQMSVSKNQARMEAEIADYFTNAKAAFDRDELVAAKKGFETVLLLQPEHVGSKVYLERIKNRYSSLAHESFKQGMDFYAAGDYDKAKLAFEKTLTIDPDHIDAKAQLEKTKELIADSTKRAQEMEKLAGAGEAYKQGLNAYQKNDLETALAKFEEVKKSVPEYEEVGRYLELTKTTLGNELFDQSQVNFQNGKLDEAVTKLKRAKELSPADTRIAPALQIAERDLATKNAEESKRLYKDGLELYLGGQTDKAEKQWRHALELDSTNDEALKAITKLEEQRKYENTNRGQ